MSRKLTDFFQSCPKQVQKRIEKDNSKEISNSLNKEKPSECSSLTIPDCSTSLSQFVQFKPPTNFSFPKTKYDARERSCQVSWFDKFPWLHYGTRLVYSVYFVLVPVEAVEADVN